MAAPAATKAAPARLRSSTTPENVIVLCGLLLLSAIYLLAAAVRRKIHERRANERKRRLLGIPTTPIASTSAHSTIPHATSAATASLVNKLRDLLMPAGSRLRHSNRHNSLNKHGLNDNLSALVSSPNSPDECTLSSNSISGDRNSLSPNGNASPMEFQGRATLNTEAKAPPSSLASLLNTKGLLGRLSTATSSTANSAKGNSRSVPSGASSNSRHRNPSSSSRTSSTSRNLYAGDEKETEQNLKKEKIMVSVRSVGVQVPPEDEVDVGGGQEQEIEGQPSQQNHLVKYMSGLLRKTG
ncbi:MAG: hypothetical protein CYPHOPRED_003563 [Cyphobasidiales sp. Tagirdzhanova-0007]|nr:MAG: hypothetical protein CYPHOPRED_003563 [Cyphobasidiales sp. Tagirdzhanova-0007]